MSSGHSAPYGKKSRLSGTNFVISAFVRFMLYVFRCSFLVDILLSILSHFECILSL